MIVNIIIGIFGILLVIYLYALAKDLLAHKEEFKQEKGSFFLLTPLTMGIHFLATMGMSDFNLSIPIFRFAKLVDDKRIPGTLLTATAAPGLLIGILYLSNVEVSVITVVSLFTAQALGTVVGVRLVKKMNAATIRKVLATALIFSICVIVTRMVWTGMQEGTLTALPLWVVACITPLYFVFGIVQMMGFGTKSLSMSLLLSLGLSPLSVLVTMLTVAGISGWAGGMQYVKSGLFQRRIALYSALAGSCGVLIGTFFVRNLNTTILQIIMIVIMIQAAINMLMKKDKKPENEETNKAATEDAAVNEVEEGSQVNEE